MEHSVKKALCSIFAPGLTRKVCSSTKPVGRNSTLRSIEKIVILLHPGFAAIHPATCFVEDEEFFVRGYVENQVFFVRSSSGNPGSASATTAGTAYSSDYAAISGKTGKKIVNI